MHNLEYWKNKHGAEYHATQLDRAQNDNETYRIQEKWLYEFFERRAKERTTSCKVLDFGCGFGRIARLLRRIEGIDYYGYDISPAMTAELRATPQKSLEADLIKRVRTADNLGSAYPDENFDFILTVSVLIHNSQENVRRVLSSMLARLAPGGRLVLLENSHTAISSFENFWHGGCWCHAFPRYLEGRADVEIFDNLAGCHGIYIVAPYDQLRESRIVYHADPQAEGEELDLESGLLRGLSKAKVTAERLDVELAEFGDKSGEIIGRIHDLTERLAISEKSASRLKVELAAAEDEAARARQAAALIKARFSERQRLMDDRLRRNANLQHSHVGHRRSGETIEWNSRRDVFYSHSRPGFERVLHIFQQEWFGIRAAAGSLPGHKLAISAEVELPHQSLLAIYKRIENEAFERIIFHGLSDQTSRLVSLLAKRGLSEIIYMIMHGAPAQWCGDVDRQMSFKTIELLKSKQIRKLHFMKAGFDYRVDGLFRPLLFNISPNFGRPEGQNGAPEIRLDGVVLAPGWSGWRKNVYTNVLAAALSEQVRSIWLHAHGIELPSPLSKKLVTKKYTSREETFQMMKMASLCLNVSLVDCHPMVNIEAQSLGCPCLRGPLFLDALDDHPYVELTAVNDVTSVVEIGERIDAVLALPPDEREGLIQDYQRQSDAVAFARYAEFLEL
jgi:SAM-dependent methyltransferase